MEVIYLPCSRKLKVLNKSLIVAYAPSIEKEAYTLATPILEVELRELKDIVRI
jgi:hypothetical protein